MLLMWCTAKIVYICVFMTCSISYCLCENLVDLWNVCMYVCVCVCVFIYVCMCVCMYVSMYVCVCMYVWMYVCVCMYVCMYVRTHARTPCPPVKFPSLCSSLPTPYQYHHSAFPSHPHITRPTQNPVSRHTPPHAALHTAPTSTAVTLRTNVKELKIRVSWRPCICSLAVMAGKFTQGRVKWTGVFNWTCRSTVGGKQRIRKKKPSPWAA